MLPSVYKWSTSKVTPSFSVLTHPIYWLTEVESWMISSLVAHWLSRFYCRKFPLRQGVSAYKMVCSSLLHRSEACLFCLHGYAQSQPNLPIGMRKLLFTTECTLHKLYYNLANSIWRHITSLQIWLYKKVWPDFVLFLSGNVYVTICSLLLFL